MNAILPSVIDTPANRETLIAEALRKAVAPADLASVIALPAQRRRRRRHGRVVPVYGFG